MTKVTRRRRWMNTVVVAAAAKTVVAHSQSVDDWKPKLIGGGALLATAFFWATYSPLHRYLYALPGAPTPSVVTAARTVIATVVLLFWSSLRSILRKGPEVNSGTMESSSSKLQPKKSTNFLNWSSGLLWLAGLELAMWNTLAAGCQAVGLISTNAIRATLLMTSGKVFTCIMALMAGHRLSRLGWIGCLLATGGSLALTFSNIIGGNVGELLEASLAGEGFIVSAAFFFSLILVRTGTLAQFHSSVELAKAKSSFMMCMSLLWVAVDCWDIISVGGSLASLWTGISDWRAWLAVSCVALGPGVLADILLSKGQQFVSALQAQIYLNTSPVWAGMIASYFLKETAGSLVWLAGFVTIFGGILATL